MDCLESGLTTVKSIQVEGRNRRSAVPDRMPIGVLLVTLTGPRAVEPELAKNDS